MKNTLLVLSIVAGQLCSAGWSSAAPNYVAHEWGTFTSVQGADGAQIVWNPLSVADLPGFVYDWPKSGPTGEREARRNFVGKSSFMTLQRMETPVIYFYSDEAMTVNALVNFPQGTMTEWYPKAQVPPPNKENPLGPRSLRWDKVELIPSTSPTCSTPLSDKSGSHYYAARETDADIIRVNGESEKFLFYRGVGGFRAPLTVTQAGNDVASIQLENTGAEELRHLFIYEVGTEGARFTSVSSLGSRQRTTVPLGQSVPFTSLATARENLSGQLEKALTREGLYAREARAMVKTWDDSWFGEKGLRVLYVLNSQWTDRVLPLTLEPRPAEIVRVMVGRAELITPRMEQSLQRQIVRYGTGSAAQKEEAVQATRALGLGRFLEPTVRRLTMANQDKAFIADSSSLLDAASKPATDTKSGKRLASN